MIRLNMAICCMSLLNKIKEYSNKNNLFTYIEIFTIFVYVSE